MRDKGLGYIQLKGVHRRPVMSCGEDQCLSAAKECEVLAKDNQLEMFKKVDLDYSDMRTCL